MTFIIGALAYLAGGIAALLAFAVLATVGLVAGGTILTLLAGLSLSPVVDEPY
jgi:hypothetical protein